MGRFDIDASKYLELVEEDADKAVRSLALNLYRKITFKTPVDTGRARANWNMSVGSPDYSTTDKAQPQQPKLGNGDGLSPIFIANALPYINKLENGYSGQAPQGMVALSVEEVKREF